MTEPADLSAYSWPASRWHEALSVLTEKTVSPAQPAVPVYAGGAVDEWLAVAAQTAGLESEAVTLSYADLEADLQRLGPALIRLPGGKALLAVLRGGRSGIDIVAPEGGRHRIPSSQLRNVLAHDLEAPLVPAVQTLLDAAGIRAERRAAAQVALLQAQLGTAEVAGGWLLRLAPGAHFFKQLRHARLPRRLGVILATALGGQFLLLAAWWMIGGGALAGHFEWGWIGGWALLLFSAIPLQLLNTKARELLALEFGAWLKQRLLYGILQLKPEQIRHQGSGQFMGLVMETASFESLALGGGLTALTALPALLIAGGVLAIGAGGLLHALLLAGWVAFAGVLCRGYYRSAREWMAFYRELTQDLVERMMGHRTRLAQEARHTWHDEEDRFLNRYLQYSQRNDRMKTRLQGVVERGWLLVAFAGIAYSFLTTPLATPATTAAFAISLGGILLGLQALKHLVAGAAAVIETLIAWQQLEPLFRARQPEQVPVLAEIRRRQHAKTLLKMQRVSFTYQAVPLLRPCSLEIHRGDRLLLEGPSGSGKSTLSALLAGLRTPDSGDLWLWDIPQLAVGLARWRKSVVTAPQFHENHVFSETFAFNLLMGRHWPPSAADLAEAEAICVELGLGDLLERMPAGFQQMVGEHGWQLSHGERSRLYIARALLQNADLMILDESFAALDPENLRQALACVLRRASTVLVIAHP